jgi:RDD family protein
MNDMRWIDGGVLVVDSVRAPRRVTGEWLAGEFLGGISAVTFGLITLRGRSLHLGPFELLRFGPPQIGGASAAWPIVGGRLAAAPQGRFVVVQQDGRLEARVDGYRPALPIRVYSLTQLPLHHALVRLQLLQLRGRRPAPGVPADVSRRAVAAAIDVGVCAAITLVFARRRRLRALAAVAVGYHVASWSVSGQTIGGGIMGLRVVAVDGSPPSISQSLLRLAMLPLSAVRMRAVHDEVAATDVIAE